MSKEASSFCAGGWGNTIASQTEILDVEHISKENNIVSKNGGT